MRARRMDADDARRNPASATQESSLCSTYGFDSSGNLGAGEVRIGKGATKAEEAEEAEEAEQKVDRTVSHATPSERCTSCNPALIG